MTDKPDHALDLSERSFLPACGVEPIAKGAMDHATNLIIRTGWSKP